ERGRPITDERGRPITDERGRPITDERGRPITDERGRPITDEHDHFISDECLRPITDDDDQNNNVSKYGMHNQKYGATIGDAMDWFKTMTTNEYIRNVKTNDWPRFNQKLWQRNYWEHIIRDEKSYDTISEYIINNPQNWETDKLK
ncbi:MAG: hypothetical protein GXX78_00515, partial [Bacteroidales bacterium]|nr:hypothetical protein [Bacteroidales bacterium]